MQIIKQLLKVQKQQKQRRL